MPNIIFITDDNKDHYLQETLNWLHKDFVGQNEPREHFWHNRSPIAEAFERCEAMVMLNEQQSAVGYMTWSMDLPSVYVEIVEIKKEYRRQGFYKQMESVLLNKFPEIAVLTANVIDQSKPIFENMGWQSVRDMNREEHFYKPVRPLVKLENTLPSGRVIALCHTDFYQVQFNREQYQNKMQYFQLDIDSSAKLQTPIVTKFHYENYIGIYFNKKLLTEGKAKHLFQTHKQYLNGSLLVIDQIDTDDKKLSCESEFFVSKNEVITNKQESEPQSSYLRNQDSEYQKKIRFFKQEFEKKKNPEESDSRPQKKHQPEHSLQLFTQSEDDVASNAKPHAPKKVHDSTDRSNILGKGQ